MNITDPDPVIFAGLSVSPQCGDLRRSKMRKQPTAPFEYLGVYVFPSTPRFAGEPTNEAALVVLHLELTGLDPGLREKAPVTTAMLLLGKRDVINQRAGLPELLFAAGVAQPSSKE